MQLLQDCQGKYVFPQAGENSRPKHPFTQFTGQTVGGRKSVFMVQQKITLQELCHDHICKGSYAHGD